MAMMLNDWIYWLSSMPQAELFLLVCPILLLDAPRYLFGSIAMWLVDMVQDLRASFGPATIPSYHHCPSVCVVIAGLNEATGSNEPWETFGKLSASEIIVVDDGSSDGMSAVAHAFANRHAGFECSPSNVAASRRP